MQNWKIARHILQALVEWGYDTKTFWKEQASYVWENCTVQWGISKGQLKELVRGSIEETPNGLLKQDAEKLTQAARNERNRPLQGGRYPYAYVDGIYLRCNWGGK